LTDTDVIRLRRESRDARKIRYSASEEKLSTKSVENDMKTINFFLICKKITYAAAPHDPQGRFRNGIFGRCIVSGKQGIAFHAAQGGCKPHQALNERNEFGVPAMSFKRRRAAPSYHSEQIAGGCNQSFSKPDFRGGLEIVS